MWEEATNYCSHERGEGWDISPYKRPNGLYHYGSTQLHERPATDTVNKDTNNTYFEASRWGFALDSADSILDKQVKPPETHRGLFRDESYILSYIAGWGDCLCQVLYTELCEKKKILAFFQHFFVVSEEQLAVFKGSNGFEEKLGERM